MIDPDRYDALVAITPFMFHVTPARNVSEILRGGLRPGSELAISTLDNFFKTRRDHVYLIEQREIAIVEVEDPRVFAVELAALDCARVDPDEDLVAEQFPEMVAISPPTRVMNSLGEEEPGQVGARADWAETTEGFDRSEVTERSMMQGRLAYRGVSPPSALQEITVPSGSVSGFIAGLPEDVRSLVSISTPRFGGWRTEVARSRAIAEAMVLAVLQAAGTEVDIRIGDPAEVSSMVHRLVGLAADLARRGRLDDAEAVAEAQAVVEMFDDFMDFPLSDIHRAQNAVVAAAGLSHVLDTKLGIDLVGRSHAINGALSSAQAM